MALGRRVPDTASGIKITRKDPFIMAYSFACKDYEGMESCPGKVVAETEEELWKLMELHAVIAHGEDPSTWDDETRAYAKTLIKTV